jgi:hypothetical protein
MSMPDLKEKRSEYNRSNLSSSLQERMGRLILVTAATHALSGCALVRALSDVSHNMWCSISASNAGHPARLIVLQPPPAIIQRQNEGGLSVL